MSTMFFIKSEGKPLARRIAEVAVKEWQKRFFSKEEMQIKRKAFIATLDACFEEEIEGQFEFTGQLSDEKLYHLVHAMMQRNDVPGDRVQEVACALYFFTKDPHGDYKWNNDTDREMLLQIVKQSSKMY